MTNTMLSSKKLLALNIGCGERKYDFEGYKTVNIDIRPDVNPDVVAACNDIHNIYNDGSVDLIFSSHVLEHLGRFEVYHIIKNWRKVLKTGGKLITIVPDLTVAAIELLSETTNPATWDILYGAQNYPENFHKCGFTKAVMEAFMKKYGFDIASITTQNREIHCTSIKNSEVFNG